MPGILDFDRWGAFNDTFHPYRVWTLTSAAPDLDLRQGDQVYEVGPESRYLDFDKKPLWGGQRFQARRPQSVGESEVMCDIEDWQAVTLFGGELPPWPLEGVALQRIHEALLDVMPMGKQTLASVLECTAKMVEYMVKKAPESAPDDSQDIPELPAEHRRALAAVGDGGHPQSIYVLTVDVPELDIRTGDVLVRAYSLKVFPKMHGRVRYLSLEDYEVLRSVAEGSYLESFAPLSSYERTLRAGMGDTLYLPAPEHQWRKEGLHRFLTNRNKWGKRLKAWEPRLAVVRPPWETLTEPIQASSDDGALFELLHQVGGLMPGQEVSDA